jgi:DNA-binding beta-propeller fold protein YncE
MRSAVNHLGSIVAIVLAVSMIDAGAAAREQDGKKKGKKDNAPVAPPVWPLPPEPTRIRYLTSYHGINDFKTKKTPRWKAALLGADDAALRSSDVLIKPYGIAVSPTGIVYVADTAARRVFAFDPDHRTVGFVGESGAGRLSKPVGVAVDDMGRVFVADASANRVFGYEADGTLAIAIGRDGELKNPSGLAIDRERRRVYVADAGQHVVACFSSVDGMAIRTIGRRGGEPGEFNFPTNLFVDRAGRLVVADTLNFRVQIFDADGRFVTTFGTQGDMPGTLNRPKGVGVDSEGHIYVVDTSFNNFQIFDGSGQLLLFVGAAGRGAGEFLLPAALYIDAVDRIYVADQGNGRVQVFQYVREAER